MQIDDPIYDKQGEKIGDDGKDDKKAYIVTGKVKKAVIKATKNGQNYTGDLTEGANVFKVPTGGAMEDVISSVEDTEKSGRENGGHIKTDANEAIRWDEGDKPSVKARNPDGTAKRTSATMKFFRVGGVDINPANGSSIEFWWHTHPDVNVEGTQLGNSMPTGGDWIGAKLLEDKGYKGNTFVIGVRDRKVSFYNSERRHLTISYDVFKSIGL